MSARHISIVGAKGTGKTVFIAALTHALTSTTEYPRIEAHPSVKRYTAGIMDDLQQGKWPASTNVGEDKNLAWEWHDRNRNKHELRTFDCAGQDFSAIFDTASEDDLSDAQLELRDKFLDSDLILLLFNLREALELHGKIGKNVERLNLSWAPACALRKLKEEGVSAYVLFTQADRYEERLREEWGNDIAKALSEVLPELHVAIEETGTQCAVVNSIETEEREGERIPVAGSHPRLPLTLNRIIVGIDEFLINHAGQPQERIEARAAAREQRAAARAEVIRQREAEAERQREAEAARKREAEAARKRREAEEARKKAEREERQRREREAKEGQAAAEAEAVRQLAENARNKKPILLPLSGDVLLELLPIPAGSFMMGSPANETGRGPNAKWREVTISKPYWMGKYEVTQAQWKAVMGNNPSQFKGAKLPVENVSWEEAMAFCKKLTEQERAAGRLPEGYRYTLPTEAEWEYACRAGTTTPFNTGNNLTTEQGNYEGNYPYNGNAKGKSRGRTTEVGSFPANAFGLYDMHGNVAEWCQDWYGDYPTGSVTDSTDAHRHLYRHARGGGWSHGGDSCRSANTIVIHLGKGSSYCGFRVALSSVVGGDE